MVLLYGRLSRIGYIPFGGVLNLLRLCAGANIKKLDLSFNFFKVLQLFEFEDLVCGLEALDISGVEITEPEVQELLASRYTI